MTIRVVLRKNWGGDLKRTILGKPFVFTAGTKEAPYPPTELTVKEARAIAETDLYDSLYPVDETGKAIDRQAFMKLISPPEESQPSPADGPATPDAPDTPAVEAAP